MTTPNNGRDYEAFVANMHRAILASESHHLGSTITIEQNKKCKGNDGLEREFDLYWQYRLGGVMHEVVIECKDYASAVSVDKIDAFVGKLQAFPAMRGVFATKTGYQSGAQTKAAQAGIELILCRQSTDDDWKDANGNPLIRYFGMTLSISTPAWITRFVPTLNGQWIKDNAPELEVLGHIEDDNNTIFVDDQAKQERYSLFDMQHRLLQLEQGRTGNYSRTERFADAYLVHQDKRLKLESFEVDYIISPPLEVKQTIDFADQLIGVIEYIRNQSKRLVFAAT